MTRQRIVALVLVAALVLSGAALVIGHLASGGGSADGSSRAAGTPTSGPTKQGAQKLKGGGVDSEIAPVKIYRQHQKGTKAGLPGLGTRSGASSRPLVTSSPKKTTVKRGGMARGFPRAIPAVPGSTVRSSSVSPSKGRVQVALDGRSAAKRSDVLRYYAIRLGRFGFVGAQAPAVGGAQAVAYQRKGGDTVTVTVTTLSKTRTGYTVFGSLRTAR